MIWNGMGGSTIITLNSIFFILILNFERKNYLKQKRKWEDFKKKEKPHFRKTEKEENTVRKRSREHRKKEKGGINCL